jgi:citrate synthase
MASDLTFTTKISGVTQKGLELRGRSLTKLIKTTDFVDSFFLSVIGKLPTDTQSKLLNAVLVACMDHGLYPASGFVPRAAASSGTDVLSAMASSLLAMGPAHGGAVTPAMKLFVELNKMSDDKEDACRRVVDDCLAKSQRLPGFGHPTYRDSDPRAEVLFKLARSLDADLTFLGLARTLESVLEEKLYRKLVLNVDGAAAAVLLTIGFPPESGNAVAGVARVTGSVAHIIEEMESGSGVRRLRADAVKYEPDK